MAKVYPKLQNEPGDEQPTFAGFVLTVIFMVLVVLLAGAVLASCGIPWHLLD
jgi:hypothetical protein